MATARVRRGRKSQDIAADYWRDIFPDVEPVAASLKGKDLLKTPGFSFEIKATKDWTPTGALKQARETVEKSGLNEYPVGIYRPRGYGPEKVAQWVVFMDHSQFRMLTQELLDLRMEVEWRRAREVGS